MSRCRRCGRELRNLNSISEGIGKVCKLKEEKQIVRKGERATNQVEVLVNAMVRDMKKREIKRITGSALL